jgi:hypothetical protein
MMSGGELYTLSKILGHKDLKMMQRQAKLSSQFVDGRGTEWTILGHWPQVQVQRPLATHPLSMRTELPKSACSARIPYRRRMAFSTGGYSRTKIGRKSAIMPVASSPIHGKMLSGGTAVKLTM